MSIADNAQAHALLIDGQDVPSAATRTVHDPATGEPIAEVADATAADAERAVAAARAAFRSGVWSRITPAERAAVIDRLADLLEERADDFARTESRNTGKPLKFSSAFDVPLTIDNLRFFAAAARNLEGKASGEYLEGLTSVDPPRADRRLRVDRAVELPAEHGRLEDRTRAGGRQHRRAQAGRADTADRADARPPGARRRPPARRAQRRAGPRTRGRRRRWPGTRTSR